MPTISNSKLPLPSNWQEFESIVVDAMKLREKSNAFSKHGRSGQNQDGVDIYGEVNNKKIGIQCKLTFKKIDKMTIEKEVENATKFKPKLDILLICTTSPRDEKIQKFVWTLEKDFRANILFWDDITSELENDMEVFRKHFPYINSNDLENDSFYACFRDTVAYVVHSDNDPCGSSISFDITSKLEGMLKDWTMPDMYSSNKNDKKIQKRIVKNLAKWLSFMNVEYMHLIHNNRYWCFNVDPIEKLEEMRKAMMTIRREIYDDFYKLYD